MKTTFRSSCPLASALDIIGDKWTLVIVRDMLLDGKTTFKELSESREKIASNILTSRLKHLEAYGILQKRKMPNNQKTNIYTLTEKGIDLAPLVIETLLWSDANIREFNKTMAFKDSGFIDKLRSNTKKEVQSLQKGYRQRVKEG